MMFHERLFALRKAADMTQNDLAEKLHVSRQAVSRWEMGTAMPDVDNLVALSELYGVTLDYLIKGEEEAPLTKAPMENAPPKKSGGKSNAWTGFMLCLFIFLWVIIALVIFNPLGRLVIAGLLVGIVWLLKILICAVIRLLRE